MKNNRGFTLVELLAVIVILAVIILLAVNAVVPQMNRARRNAFITEANTFVGAAESYYQAVMLDKGNLKTGDNIDFKGGCVSINSLIGDYIKKDRDKDIYKGSVKIEINQTTNETTYTIWLSNKQYQLEAVKSADLKETSVKAYTADASTTCGGAAS